MTDQHTNTPVDPWHVFKAWHDEPAFYREVYTRTVATLLAALIVYLIAVFAGLVDRTPAVIALGIVLAIGLLLLVFSIPVAVRHWKHMRGLFIRWSADQAPEAVMARNVYNRLVFGIYTTAIAGGLLLAVLLQQ